MSKTRKCFMKLLHGNVLPVFIALLFFFLTPVFAIDVNLAWNANTEPNLAGYRVYKGRASRTYDPFIPVGNVTTYTVQNLSAGNNYFAVTAVDTNGNESAFSVEVVANLVCTYTISPTVVSVGQAAQTGSVTVTSSTGCNWSAASSDTWITFPLGNSGTGSGTLNYSLAVNATGLPRTGTITIAGQTVTVTQAGISCTYGISSTTQSFGISGGTGNVSVTATSGCNWTAGSNASWLNISAGGIGIGNGTVTYTVSTNTSTSSRSGTLTIAGQTFTVNQAGVSCTYSISPTTQDISLSGGSGSVTVTTGTGCNWTAVSNAIWLTVTSGGTGSGPGNSNYSVAANTTGSSRSGTITIAGQTLTVTQDVPACSYSISPTSRTFSEGAGTGSVAVTGTSGCNWTASSNAPWLTITTVIFGTNGIVNYSVAANTTTASRTGTLTIAGQTYTVTQSGITCTHAISPTTQSFAAGADAGSVAVTTPGGCGWTATSNDSWLIITSGGSGSGAGAVNYSVAANPTINPRTGTLTVAGQTFSVTQQGVSCTYFVSPASQSFADGSGTGIVTVTSPSGCNWTATSNDGWLTVSSGGSGSGNGSVNYSVAANTTISSRTGTLTVAGQTFSVTQAGIPCTYSISPTSQSFTDSPGTGTVTVTSNTGCTWTASSNAPWLTVTGGTGFGNGTVNYSVAANTTINSRSGTLTVAGQTFNVTQAGISCTYSISPGSQSFSESAGTGSVTVTSITGCNWTATSNVGWLSVTSGGSGSGNGTVNYSVAANTTINPRTGTLTIGGQTFSVTQAGIPCTYSISPTSQSVSNGAANFGTNVTSPTGCNWTATSNDSWITISSGATGTGNGSVTYSVAANTTISTRTGTLTVAGQTLTVTQAGISCTYFISPTNQSFSDAAGSGTVTITATSGCSWIATSSTSWLTITSGATGSGNGSVNYSVAANTTINSRTGTVTVAGQTLTVTQAGVGCTYSISPTSQSFSASAGTGSVTMTSLSGCTWTAASNASWIIITSGGTGSGNGSVNYSVVANTTAIARTGTVTVGGQTLTVTQAGVGCTYSISPASQSFSNSAGTGSVTVSSLTGCNWTATSNAPWLTIAAGASGSGNGSVNYLVAANTTTSSRTGTLTVAGQTHTVTQTGISCTFSIVPTSQSFTDSAGTGSVAVGTPAGCNWTASSNVTWVTITSGENGSGNGNVGYLVAANTTTSLRTGTLTIAGQTLTVTQFGISCTYTISPTSQSFGDGAGNGSITVTSPNGCNWIAVSDSTWLTISSGSSGSANGIVGYSVAANATTGSRTGRLTVGGQTFTVTQAGAGCTYSLSGAGQSFVESGGTATVALTATSGCAWVAVSNANWLTINSGANGSGNGIIDYSVAPNTTSISRTGTLLIAGQTFTITQSGASCTYALSPTGQSFINEGGIGTVAVSATGGCSWTAASNAPWLTISSGGSGVGNGAVNYSVAANTTPGSRIGTLTIAGQTFTVTQSDTGCVSSLSPVSQSFVDNGGTGSVSVVASGGCTWTPTSNVSWITITFVELPGGAAGGTGRVNFSVAANTTTNFRTGTVRIEGLTFTVNQSGVGCSSTISPTIQSFSESGGSGSLTVTVTGPCGATPQSNASWITLTSVVLPGSSSGGAGVIRFSVAPNPSFNSRTGTVTLAGQTFTVTQAGTGCIYSVFPDSQSFSKSAGTGAVSVIANSGCPWTASSGVSWITLTTGNSGTGDGTLNYAVEAAGTISFRSGVLTVAGQNITVTQTSTHTTSFSQFANGADWTSSLVLTNPSPTEVATGSATFYDSTGAPVSLSINGQAPASSVSFAIQPLGGTTLRTDGLGSLVSGSIQVNANSPVAGVVKYSHRTLGLTGVGESIPLRSLMTFVLMDANRGINTGIALTNLQSGTAQITLSLRGLDGREVSGGAASQSIPSNGQISKFVNEFFPAANTANFQGTLIVTATGLGNRVTATAIQIGTLSGQFASLPVVPVDPAQVTRQLFFAQFVNGGGWSSSLYVVNPSSSLSGNITSFLDGQGNFLDISGPGGTTLDTVIEPLGGAVLETDGQGQQKAGSARLISSHPVGGVLVFSSPTVGTAGVGSSIPMTRFITPIARDATGSTGVAIASVGSAVTLRLELRNQRGEIVPGGQITLDLPPNGHVARYLEQLFPDADTSNFEGTLSVFAEGGNVVGTALLLGTRKDELAALPVTAIR